MSELQNNFKSELLTITTLSFVEKQDKFHRP